MEAHTLSEIEEVLFKRESHTETSKDRHGDHGMVSKVRTQTEILSIAKIRKLRSKLIIIGFIHFSFTKRMLTAAYRVRRQAERRLRTDKR